MGTHALPLPDEHRDKLRGTLVVSLVLHVLLFVVIVTYTLIHFNVGGTTQTWGNSATKIGAVTSLPGMPLPTPMLTTQTTVATQNPAPYKSDPQPKEPPPPDATQIPKFKDEIKPEKLKLVNKRIQPPDIPPPDNAVPYGQTGAPTMNYTQTVTAAGPSGFSLGEANNFGQRYGYYVTAMRNRISANWLMATISPNILTAPRTYLTFEILRDGTVNNVQITQSSGIPEVDRSALRAILASNPLPPLPADYRGDSVAVQFYFDFHR